MDCVRFAVRASSTLVSVFFHRHTTRRHSAEITSIAFAAPETVLTTLRSSYKRLSRPALRWRSVGESPTWSIWCFVPAGSSSLRHSLDAEHKRLLSTVRAGSTTPSPEAKFFITVRTTRWAWIWTRAAGIFSLSTGSRIEESLFVATFSLPAVSTSFSAASQYVQTQQRTVYVFTGSSMQSSELLEKLEGTEKEYLATGG